MDEGGSRNPFLRLFSKKKTDDEQMEQEIISMVDEAHEQGALRESESMMIHNVLALDEKEAKDIMTHRKNIVAIDGNTPFSKAMDFIIEETHSRFPVYEEDIDNIIGAIHIREVLMYAKDPSVQNMPIKDIPNLIFEVDFIPETKNLDALFKEMQMKKSHIVIVVDEYGQTAGIVALEDILEEIVGNIYDEFDSAEPPEIVQLEDNLWRISGGAYVEDIAEALDLDLPEDIDYDTLGGMIFSCLRIIPADGSQFDVQVNGLNIHVEKMEDQRVESALVSKILPEKEEEE